MQPAKMLPNGVRGHASRLPLEPAFATIVSNQFAQYLNNPGEGTRYIALQFTGSGNPQRFLGSPACEFPNLDVTLLRLPNPIPARKSPLDTVSLRATVSHVIRSFRHKGLERFFTTGSRAGIQSAHARKLENRLFALNEAETPTAMNVSGWHLHQLQSDLAGRWSVRVNGDWRMTFRFDGEDAILVDYRDYH